VHPSITGTIGRTAVGPSYIQGQRAAGDGFILEDDDPLHGSGFSTTLRTSNKTSNYGGDTGNSGDQSASPDYTAVGICLAETEKTVRPPQDCAHVAPFEKAARPLLAANRDVIPSAGSVPVLSGDVMAPGQFLSVHALPP
jgi:hypothetical protein